MFFKNHPRTYGFLMELFLRGPFVPSVALSVPSTLAFAAIAAPRRARLASSVALGLVLLFVLGTALRGGAPTGGASLGVRVDTATCAMLLLVASLGAIVVRYSQTYLHGEPGLARYLRWLLLTLAAVTALVIADNLLVIAVSWTATSLALHQLLTFYADRPAALVAAHKKFLVSRLADGCLAGTLAIVHANVGSFQLDHIAAWVGSRADLPLSMEVAAGLLVVAVALRSAQLPFHGWLTQVMEAPTPVSALLHAGVVNIGGFILIRLAPWVERSVSAQVLLVAIGLLSTVVAALVMTTRVSIKVALAWSTCAQMGFMLLECGLGLWPLALLHLVAHSLYKAYAFLSAGSAVDDWRTQALTPPRPPVTSFRLAIAASVAVGCTLLGLTVLRPHLGASPSYPADLVLAVLVGLSLVPLLATATGPRAVVGMAPRVVGVVLLYFGWHVLAERLVPVHVQSSHAIGWGLTGLAFVGLFAVKAALHLRPHGTFARALHPWLFSGLYLDELFTRLTFRVWPPQLPEHTETPRAIRTPATLEVQA